MSTFSKLTLVAQYDDMCRLVNQLVKDSCDEEEASISLVEQLQKRWEARRVAHERDKQDLKGQVDLLQREIKKLNRQLEASRSALVRENDEKKAIANEKKALLEHIRQVKLLLEKPDCLVTSDAQRRRVFKCLDVDRLSPIASDDSDDCVSGLDYDRTDDDILDTERSRRSIGFDDALENLPNNEQPTLLCRYLDKDLDSNSENNRQDEPRRSSRRGATVQRLSSHRDVATSHRDKLTNLASETDSNGMETDDNDIEYFKQELQKIEAEKRDKLASARSTPHINNQNKGATLSASRAISNVSSTPVPSEPKPHSFANKKIFKPENCGPCGRKISFYGNAVKCENCGVVAHPECQDKCPLPCVKITAPNTRSRQKKILISDFVNNDAVPKVPALIVHCCNEIEREDKIISVGLYRVVTRTSDIENLQTKILKSKSGMPNLSKEDVHLLTGVVKRFLQSLDESLITTTLWSHFSEAITQKTNLETTTHMIYYIAYDLPTANRDTLAYLMLHLHAIAKHSDKNMMTISNLAKTLAPTIIGNSCRNPPSSTILQESKIQIQIMEALFEIEEEFWTRFVHKSTSVQTPKATSLGSRLLGTPSSSKGPTTRSSTRMGGTLPTPRLKPLFS